MKIQNFKKIDKGSLLGKLDLEFEEWGLTIRDILLLNGKNGMWLSMPSRSYEAEGKKKYFSFVIFDKEKITRITERVIKSLENELKEDAPSQDCPF